MKKLTIVALLGVLSFAVSAQSPNWNSSTNCMYTTDRVGIGLSSCPSSPYTTYNLVVVDPTNTNSKALLGGTWLVPGTSVASSASVWEIQAEGPSSVSLVGSFDRQANEFDHMTLSSTSARHVITCASNDKSQIPFSIEIVEGDYPNGSFTWHQPLRLLPSGETRLGYDFFAPANSDMLSVNGDISLEKNPDTDPRSIYGRSDKTSLGLYAAHDKQTGAAILLHGLQSTGNRGMIEFTSSWDGSTMPQPPLKAFSFNVEQPPVPGSDIVMDMYKDGFVMIPGAVSIGSNSTFLDPVADDTKLAVEGLIACRELKVLPTGISWPDYVFEENYTMMTLSDVDNFVKTNKHLPHLPSAAIVEKEGRNIAETQAQILQTVEELYLHVIELKRENEELRKQIASMSNN